jgi:Ulp1 family protease
MKKDQKKKATKKATSSSASPPTSSKKHLKAATSSSSSPTTMSQQPLKAATSSSSSPTTSSKQPLKRLKAKTPCPQEETSEQPVDKIALRRRVLSRAYHQARVLALKEAWDENCIMDEEMKKEAEARAKVKAQEAYKAAAIAFDK